jgi:hypothetical protein
MHCLGRRAIFTNRDENAEQANNLKACVPIKGIFKVYLSESKKIAMVALTVIRNIL